MKTLAVLLILAGFVLAAFALPQQIQYQGSLTRANGTPLDTTVAITFNIYNASTFGLLLWTETHSAVVVQNGSFTAQLGSVLPITDAVISQPQTWLGIVVGNDSEMAPRTQFLSVPYAYRVATIDAAGGGTVYNDVTIVGKGNIGTNNTNAGQYAFVTGANNHADNQYSSISGGVSNYTGGTYAHVGGGGQNRAGDEAGGSYQTVGGGASNFAGAHGSTVAGGLSDSARGNSSAILGGANNLTAGISSLVGGGQYNRASGDYSVIVGGGGPGLADSNSTLGEASAVGGGRANRAAGHFSTVGGGEANTAGSMYSTVSGGNGHAASGFLSTIAGGQNNTASGVGAAVSGGDYNTASGNGAAVGGGDGNTAAAQHAAIGGGSSNTASGFVTTVGGGFFNTVSDTFSTVAGGRYNRASGGFATVAGGDSNLASGHSGTVGGGQFNTALGYASSVPGGYDNHANGDYSFCAGRTAWTSQPGCFLWADASGTGITTSLANSFRALASGGVYFRTSSTLNVGALLDAGSGSWQNICDVNKKRLHGDVNTAETLQKVVNLPLHRWSYKSQSDQVQHIGPTAQDFRAAFQLGESDTTINTVDPDGVALAAIQELAKQNLQKDAELSALRAEVAELRRLMQSSLAQNQHTLNLSPTENELK